MSAKNDINGKESSKRKWASRFLWVGYFTFLFYVTVWGVVSLFLEKEIHFADNIMEMWKWLMGFGSTILLGTVFERLGKNKDDTTEINK